MPEIDHVLGVCVGNTRTRWGLFAGEHLEESASIDNADPAKLVSEVAALAGRADLDVIALASVNNPVSDAIERALAPRRVLRLGRELEAPVATEVAERSKVGQDRLLCAAAAFARSRGACVVIDAGTAITVDFVDDEGVFRGGAIAPGLRMMLRALHEHTAALPEVRFEPEPRDPPYGRETTAAMRIGAREAAIGLVHRLIDLYAVHHGTYPAVVATGGDSGVLFEDDELVEHVVPDLQLMGLRQAVEMWSASQDQE